MHSFEFFQVTWPMVLVYLFIGLFFSAIAGGIVVFAVDKAIFSGDMKSRTATVVWSVLIFIGAVTSLLFLRADVREDNTILYAWLTSDKDHSTYALNEPFNNVLLDVFPVKEIESIDVLGRGKVDVTHETQPERRLFVRLDDLKKIKEYLKSRRPDLLSRLENQTLPTSQPTKT